MLDDPIRVGSRRWIAWKLVQLSCRIYDTTFYQRITVRHESGEVVAWVEARADAYSSGIHAMYGTKFGEYTLEWEDSDDEFE